jgi:hypothetical protein
MVLVNLGFRMWKNFSENYLEFGNAPSEMFVSPVLGPESLKNARLRWRQIIILPGTPARIGRPWCRSEYPKYHILNLEKWNIKSHLNHDLTIDCHSLFTFRRFRVRILALMPVAMFAFYLSDFYVLSKMLEWRKHIRPSVVHWKWF